jgi:DNA (cytosine-5)-methyltransferase 1
MNDGRFKFYEFFAGGGNDFDSMKSAAYKANFGDSHFREGDVWKLRAADLPGHADLAWASSPCQDVSLAGSRAGLAGGRSSAFFGFWKLMEALVSTGRAPKVIVVENVVGLLTSHDGGDFVTLCEKFAEQGYQFGALEIDAARFLPQSRPRVFIVASRIPVPAQLLAVEPIKPFHSARVVSAAAALPEKLRNSWLWWKLSFPPPSNETLREKLDEDVENSWFSIEKRDHILGLIAENHREKLDRARRMGGEQIATVFRRMRVEAGKKVQRAELRFDGNAGCIRTPGGGSSRQLVLVVNKDDVRVRHLSPSEGARLMGLGEEYKLPVRKTAAFRVIGDGVAVPVVRFLADNLLERLVSANSAHDHDEQFNRRVALTR